MTTTHCDRQLTASAPVGALRVTCGQHLVEPGGRRPIQALLLLVGDELEGPPDRGERSGRPLVQIRPTEGDDGSE